MLAFEGETLGSESRVDNLLNLWSALSLRRQIIVVAATLGMFLAILGLANYARTPSMSLLFSSLDSQSAGEIISALDQRNAAYEVRGDAIYVSEGERDSLRMVLAGEGLPAVGEGGYELLDGLNGFGTTSQMFDAAYWRAKEGELARTILALPEIRAVRVHLARTPNELFQPEQVPTASVTVTTRSGGLSGQQAKAIRHLIAGAVSGMRADDVAVIDSVAGLIPSENDGANPMVGADARAAEIRRNLEHLLDARVGPGRSVVEVAVDVITDREQVTQTTFDPQSRVVISSESQEKSGNSNGTAGSVTVASNLPNGNANGGSQNTSQSSEKQEKVNYEVSQTKTEVLKMPGSVRKISVAVLVDGEAVPAADGTVTLQPRTDAELSALQELVSSAAGLDTARGDVLTIKSMLFQPSLAEGTSADAGFLPNLGTIDLMSAIQLAVLALVALVLGLFVVRPVLTGARRAAALPPPEARLALPGVASSGGFGGADGMALTGEIDDGDGFALLGGEDQAEGAGNDPVARLRRLIEERQAESVEILRGWMEPDEERV